MISVVTAAYNAESHIENMIISVLSQPEKVQLIVVNDGSKDKTSEICQQCQIKYGAFDYYEIDNHGAGYARNYGIRRATGEWIIFLDSDDLLIDGVICKELVTALEQYGKTGIDIVYSCKAKSDFFLEEQPIISYPEENVKFHMPMMEFWTCIYNRNFLVENNICFFEYQEQDIESAFRYRAFSKANKVINRKNLCFYLQRDNPVSNMHTFNPSKLYRIKAMVYDALLRETEFRSDYGFLISEKQMAVFRYFDNVMLRGGTPDSKEDLEYMLSLLNNMGEFDCTQVVRLGVKKFYKYLDSYMNCKKISRKVKRTEIITMDSYLNESKSFQFEATDICDFIDRWRRVSKKVAETVK